MTQTLTTLDPTPPAPEPDHLHDRPPITIAGVLLRWRYTVPALIGGFVFLALAAAIAGGRLLLTWDKPIQQWIESNRTDFLDTFFIYATRLGSLQVVIFGLVVLLLIAFRKCPSLFMLLLGAALARPLFEFVLKASVGRERPNLDRLVGADGPSFPSGHPLAAIALWGLVPPVVALATNRRFWWWVATAVSGTAIVLVAASRVYMGVHWFSDAVGSLLFGAVFLLVVERLVDVGHRRYPCPTGCPEKKKLIKRLSLLPVGASRG